MATRAIVTSHPVVACDVCGRRLLRGENPDAFLAGGQRRMVCELCVPRAAAEGWLREADSHTLSVRPPRSHRAGSLLGRLRQLREPGQRPLRLETRPDQDAASGDERGRLSTEGLYDFLDRGAMERAEPYERELYIGSVEAGGAAESRWSTEPDGARLDERLVEDGPPGDQTGAQAAAATGGQTMPSAPTNAELKVRRALEVFNAGEQPRRVAGVARSLGAPTITVRPVGESGGTVAIVVAWELCWYRYEIDLGNEAAGAQLVAQGMELEELPAEDRLANAGADERGELAVLFG